jgi:L-2,4-diaminobutyric acid acetyltransferase
MTTARTTFRPPRPADAARVWRMVPAVGELERNSAYAYLLLCTHFADTSLVAEADGELIGFVLGYRPPTQPSSVFVWQIGVAPEARGVGLGRRMLDVLLRGPGCRGARDLCATVSPDNVASRALFHSWARRRGARCVEAPCFEPELFPEPHPAEHLLRIGPV